MSYTSNLDVAVKETLGQIYDSMYRLVPEEIGTDERAEAEIAQLVYGLVNTALKGEDKMPRYEVEYYFAETQTETIEANSEEEAKQSVLDDLNYQHDLLHRPTDMIFGVCDVRELEEE